MKLKFKINWSLVRSIEEDLKRPHSFAFERVGFIHCRAAEIPDGLMAIAQSYEPVSDEHYINDETAGARINGSAIRAALQTSLTNRTGIFHVHMHEHFGIPKPSQIDLAESKKFVPDFFNVTPHLPHGTLILSEDKAFGLCWLGKNVGPQIFDRIEITGAPLRLIDVRI